MHTTASIMNKGINCLVKKTGGYRRKVTIKIWLKRKDYLSLYLLGNSTKSVKYESEV